VEFYQKNVTKHFLNVTAKTTDIRGYPRTDTDMSPKNGADTDGYGYGGHGYGYEKTVSVDMPAPKSPPIRLSIRFEAPRTCLVSRI
jgi:hypothetical protein